jgi:30S ribosomal protein S31
MGRGDKKTKKGKISSGSFGVSRPHNKKTETETVKKEKPKAKEEKKTEKAEAKTTDTKKKDKK